MNGEIYEIVRYNIQMDYEINRKNVEFSILLNKVSNYDFTNVKQDIWICIPTPKILQFFKIYLNEISPNSFGISEELDVSAMILDEEFQENSNHYAVGHVWLFESDKFELNPEGIYTFNEVINIDTNTSTPKQIE